jgi:hypothetical protein
MLARSLTGILRNFCAHGTGFRNVLGQKDAHVLLSRGGAAELECQPGLAHQDRVLCTHNSRQHRAPCNVGAPGARWLEQRKAAHTPYVSMRSCEEATKHVIGVQEREE